MDANQNSHREKSLDQANTALLDEAEALIWALLDDDGTGQLEPANIKRLEVLLQENEQVRQRYISCVQMHTDLHQHFGEHSATPSLPPSPVLGSLGDFTPTAESFPPVIE